MIVGWGMAAWSIVYEQVALYDSFSGFDNACCLSHTAVRRNTLQVCSVYKLGGELWILLHLCTLWHVHKGKMYKGFQGCSEKIDMVSTIKARYGNIERDTNVATMLSLSFHELWKKTPFKNSC